MFYLLNNKFSFTIRKSAHELGYDVINQCIIRFAGKLKLIFFKKYTPSYTSYMEVIIECI